MDRVLAPVRVRMLRTAPVLAGAYAVALALGLVDPRLIFLVVLPAWWALARAHRLSVAAGEAGLTVRNPWRTHVVPWAEVGEVGVRRHLRTAVPVAGGVPVWALATPVGAADLGAAVLRSWVARYA